VIVNAVLQDFFSSQVKLGRDEPVVIAFSGGPDSLALACGLKQVARQGAGRPFLCHVDHCLDPDSSRRAREAKAIARLLEIPIEVVVQRVDQGTRAEQGTEAAARQARYDALERVRLKIGARWIATAHHQDDQIETTLIRLMFGSGFNGLSGIPSKRDRVVRPFLQLTRSQLEGSLEGHGIDPITDPTNRDLTVPRNRVRQLILPKLEDTNPTVRHQILRLGRISGALYSNLERSVRTQIEIKTVGSSKAILRSQLRDLPLPLVPTALALLHKSAGIPLPPRQSAVGDFIRQIQAGNRIGCDCGDSWRWEDQGPYVILRRNQQSVASFAYTVKVPGECELPELSMRFRIRKGPVAAWMFQSSKHRAALELPIQAGDTVLLRSRQPGDRFTPLGCCYSRRLKDVLIDKGVPRHERSRLPLLFVDRQLAWVPGVTIAEPYRLTTGSEAWIAELETT
jgi:tRNA(Ile)-lysidine synthase